MPDFKVQAFRDGHFVAVATVSRDTPHDAAEYVLKGRLMTKGTPGQHIEWVRGVKEIDWTYFYLPTAKRRLRSPA